MMSNSVAAFRKVLHAVVEEDVAGDRPAVDSVLFTLAHQPSRTDRLSPPLTLQS